MASYYSFMIYSLSCLSFAANTTLWLRNGLPTNGRLGADWSLPISWTTSVPTRSAWPIGRSILTLLFDFMSHTPIDHLGNKSPWTLGSVVLTVTWWTCAKELLLSRPCCLSDAAIALGAMVSGRRAVVARRCSHATVRWPASALAPLGTRWPASIATATASSSSSQPLTASRWTILTRDRVTLSWTIRIDKIARFMVAMYAFVPITQIYRKVFFHTHFSQHYYGNP